MLRQIRKTTKKTPFILEVAITIYVETYSSAKAAAQDPDKREKLKAHTITTFNTRKENLSRTYSLKQNCELKVS